MKLEFEKKQGFSDLELICAEIEQMDESRLTRKQMKKERKKEKKQTTLNEINSSGKRLTQIDSTQKADMAKTEIQLEESTNSKSDSKESPKLNSSLSASNSSIELAGEVQDEFDHDEHEESPSDTNLSNNISNLIWKIKTFLHLLMIHH